MNSLGENLTN